MNSIGSCFGKLGSEACTEETKIQFGGWPDWENGSGTKIACNLPFRDARERLPYDWLACKVRTQFLGKAHSDKGSLYTSGEK